MGSLAQAEPLSHGPGGPAGPGSTPAAAPSCLREGPGVGGGRAALHTGTQPQADAGRQGQPLSDAQTGFQRREDEHSCTGLRNCTPGAAPKRKVVRTQRALTSFFLFPEAPGPCCSVSFFPKPRLPRHCLSVRERTQPPAPSAARPATAPLGRLWDRESHADSVPRPDGWGRTTWPPRLGRTEAGGPHTPATHQSLNQTRRPCQFAVSPAVCSCQDPGKGGAHEHGRGRPSRGLSPCPPLRPGACQ